MFMHRYGFIHPPGTLPPPSPTHTTHSHTRKTCHQLLLFLLFYFFKKKNITDLQQQFEFIPGTLSRPSILLPSLLLLPSFLTSPPPLSPMWGFNLLHLKLKDVEVDCHQQRVFCSQVLVPPPGEDEEEGWGAEEDEEDKTLSCCRIPESVVIFSSPAFHFQRQTNTFQHLTLEKSTNFYLFFFPPSPLLMICSPPCRRCSSQVIICLRVSRFDAGVEANIASDCQEPFFSFLFFPLPLPPPVLKYYISPQFFSPWRLEQNEKWAMNLELDGSTQWYLFNLCSSSKHKLILLFLFHIASSFLPLFQSRIYEKPNVI